jgi:hypothetical protein
VIVAEVQDPAEHARRVRDPDGYRPEQCGRCQHSILHVHDRRERGDGHGGVVVLLRFLCAACLAAWRVVPGFMARYLRRPWAEVEAATLGPEDAAPPGAPAVPARTVRRWRARLAAAASDLLERLAERRPRSLPARPTRRDLVLTWATAHALRPGHRLADLAALLHQLCPGVRVM